jgi:hypothetical protein
VPRLGAASLGPPDYGAPDYLDAQAGYRRDQTSRLGEQIGIPGQRAGYPDPEVDHLDWQQTRRAPDYRAQGYRQEDFQRPARTDRVGDGYRPDDSAAGGHGRQPDLPAEDSADSQQDWMRRFDYGAPPDSRDTTAHADVVTYPGWGADPEAADAEPADAEFPLYGPAEPRYEPVPRGGRSAGRGRGRTGARRGKIGKWLGLGGAVVIAAAAAVAVVFGGLGVRSRPPRPSPPAHLLYTPQRIGSYTRDPQAEQELGLSHGEHYLTQIDPGHVSGIVAAVYDTRGVPGSPDSAAVIAGRLGSTPVSVVIKSFMQQETAEGHGPVTVPAGPLGGSAACAGSTQSAICVWADGDTVGVVVSAAMNARQLSSVALIIRSGVEVQGHRTK